MTSVAKKAVAKLLERAGRQASRSLDRRLASQDLKIERLRLLVGQLHAERVRALPAGTPLNEAEFRVFSQWGQDGIIEHLLAHVPVERQVFVEFGVQDYTESNTRFLLQHRNWSGLVLDGEESHIAAIRSDDIYWRYDLRAQHAFVTAESIDELIADAGVRGDIGLLGIDIDGVDYWVWRSIEVIEPRIVICEYNSLFGAERAVTVPYSPDFRRASAHYSNLYFGASLAALCDLGEAKGYAFVGCASAGNDAFFVRRDCLGDLRPLTAAEGFVAGKARESRDPAGRLTHLGRDEARALIADRQLVDVRTGGSIAVGELDA